MRNFRLRNRKKPFAAEGSSRSGTGFRATMNSRLSFAAAPRFQKVLDLGQHWLGPFYGSALLMEYMTLGYLQHGTHS